MAPLREMMFYSVVLQINHAFSACNPSFPFMDIAVNVSVKSDHLNLNIFICPYRLLSISLRMINVSQLHKLNKRKQTNLPELIFQDKHIIFILDFFNHTDQF